MFLNLNRLGFRFSPQIQYLVIWVPIIVEVLNCFNQFLLFLESFSFSILEPPLLWYMVHSNWRFQVPRLFIFIIQRPHEFRWLIIWKILKLIPFQIIPSASVCLSVNYLLFLLKKIYVLIRCFYLFQFLCYKIYF